jgi:Fe2+ or Zn2+ uptake regulation protein
MDSRRVPLFDDDSIARVFQNAGHRLTTHRMALLNVMRRQGGFLDAEALHELANLRGANLSLATVYRTLALFKELNLVEGRIVGEDQVREEYRFRSQQQHYTLTCKRCGAIVPVESDIVDAFRREVTATLSVTVLSAHSCFIGYCAACTAALAQEEEGQPPAY